MADRLVVRMGEQGAALCEHLSLSTVNVIGSSGSALAAINLALSHPELMQAVAADSFEGERALPAVTGGLRPGRQASKKDAAARVFDETMNGDNREQVVDADMQAILTHAARIGAFFHMPLSTLSPDILLTGSSEDEFWSGFFKPCSLICNRFWFLLFLNSTYVIMFTECKGCVYGYSSEQQQVLGKCASSLDACYNCLRSACPLGDASKGETWK